MVTTFLCACACASAVTPPAVLDSRPLIEQALDEPAKITLDNIKLGEAIQIIAEQTGVKIVMPPDVMDLVPHGADTLVQKVQIANMPLRRGLTNLFSPLGMTFVVRGDHVAVVPKEALLCLGRPPTWPELDTLTQLSGMPLGTDGAALTWLQARVQFVVPVSDAWGVLTDAIRNVGAGPGDEVLTVACRNLGWGWCLSDQRIVVAPMQEQVRRRLQEPISLRLNNRALFDVLQAIGEKTNLKIRSEPGAIASLPLYIQRNFSLNVHQLSAELVLDKIATSAGLGYLLEPDGVLFYREGPGTVGTEPTPDSAEAPAAAPSSDPYVGTIDVPLGDGRTWHWAVRASELPEDLRQRRDRDLAEGFEALRRQTAGSRP